MLSIAPTVGCPCWACCPCCPCCACYMPMLRFSFTTCHPCNTLTGHGFCNMLHDPLALVKLPKVALVCFGRFHVTLPRTYVVSLVLYSNLPVSHKGPIYSYQPVASYHYPLLSPKPLLSADSRLTVHQAFWSIRQQETSFRKYSCASTCGSMALAL